MSTGGHNGRRRLVRSLRGQMIAAVMVTVATVIAVFLAIAWVQLDELGDEQASARARAVDDANRRAATSLCRNTAVASAAAMLEGGYSYLQTLADTADDSNQDVAYVIIVDDAGRVVAHSRRTGSEVPTATVDDELSRMLTKDAAPDAVVAAPDPTTPRLQVFAARIQVDDGEVIGHVRIAMRMDAAERAAHAARDAAQSRVGSVLRLAAIAAAVLLMLGIASAVTQATRLARPIRELSDTAQRIAEGDLGQRVKPAGVEEIARLGRTFNDMSVQLQSLMAEAAHKAALEKEVEIARAVQGALVPPSTLQRTGAAELLGYFQPATKCGGDWWMSKELADGRVLVLIGDVTGHGLPPALITAAAIGCVETLPPNVTTEEALAHLDRAVARANQGEAGLFMMSCFAMILDPAAETLTFCNGGHTNPYVIAHRDVGWRLASLLARGPLLGDIEPAMVRPVTTPLIPDDIYVLYTDGVSECYSPDGEQWGERRLQNALTRVVGQATEHGTDLSLADARAMIIDALRNFAGDAEQRDDITLVLVRVRSRAQSVSVSGDLSVAG